jgi:hypothetical protein
MAFSVKVTDCPQCGEEEVSDKAKACPSCGYPTDVIYWGYFAGSLFAALFMLGFYVLFVGLVGWIVSLFSDDWGDKVTWLLFVLTPIPYIGLVMLIYSEWKWQYRNRTFRSVNYSRSRTHQKPISPMTLK